MLKRVKVFDAETRQGGAVDLGVAANVVVDARLEAAPVRRVDPVLRRLITVLLEDGIDLPVLTLLRQEVAAFD